jgi:hypothetical protein
MLSGYGRHNTGCVTVNAMDVFLHTIPVLMTSLSDQRFYFVSSIVKTIMDNEFISEGYKAGLLAAGQAGHDRPGSCARYTCTHAGLIPQDVLRGNGAGGGLARDADGLMKEDQIRGKILGKNVEKERLRSKEAQSVMKKEMVQEDSLATKDSVRGSFTTQRNYIRTAADAIHSSSNNAQDFFSVRQG